MKKIILLIVSVLTLSLTVSSAQPYQNMIMMGRDGEELFYSDSLNKYMIFRPYPVPERELTPASKGFRPVYISTYARHGSRKLHRSSYTETVLEVLGAADKAGALTALGADVYRKVGLIAADLEGCVGDLTSQGEAQHRGIAERMYANFKPVFETDGAVVRCWSTAVQRTMMSMFACNARLLELVPDLHVERAASNSLTYLNNRYPSPYVKDIFELPFEEFLERYIDVKPVLSRLFVDGAPEIADTSGFIRCLYINSAIVRGLDLEGVDFMCSLFPEDELYSYAQAYNYLIYTKMSSSPVNGMNSFNAQKPLLRDILDKADEVLASGRTGADLRFGHDSFLTPLVGLLGVNGYNVTETDPLKVMDVFQDFSVAPMAGNLQLIFYRNKAGDVLVKFLHNEIESTVPVPTDMFPYYDWTSVRDYILSILE